MQVTVRGGQWKKDERETLLIIQETREDIQKVPSHHTPSIGDSILGHAGAWVVYVHASSSRRMVTDSGPYA
jgi:hypothetical protein